MPDTYYSIDDLTFVWDEDKNQKNISKHGINFKQAALVFNDDLRLEFEDVTHNADEERYDVIGLVEDVLFVVYCDRDNLKTGNTDIRLISARLADSYEIAAYNNNIHGRV